MTSEYLLFNVLILVLSSIGLVFKKYSQARWVQSPSVIPAMKSISVVAIFYLLWDALVTNWWWSFNPKYILGVQIGPLPIEEVLFFVTVPWSCLIIWVNINVLVTGTVRKPIETWLGGVSTLLCLVALHQQWWYTASICLLGGGFCVLSLKQNKWLRQRSSLVFLATCFVLIGIFNGYLTARPIVIYNQQVKTPLHVGSIPVEDVMYGLVLVGATVIMYEYFKGSVRNKQ